MESKSAVTMQLEPLLLDSGIFDAEWYCGRYPDVPKSGIPPLEHFLRFGFWMARDPGPGFSRDSYTALYPDVANGGGDPLLHYLRHGRGEGRLAGSAQPAIELSQSSSAERVIDNRISGHVDRIDVGGIVGWAIDLDAPDQPVALRLLVDGAVALRFHTSIERHDVVRAGMPGKCAGFRINFPAGILRKGQRLEVRAEKNGAALNAKVSSVLDVESPRGDEPLPLYLEAVESGSLLPVVIVVPVYNAHDAVRECLESVARTLPEWARVLVVDDASPDPRISELLDTWTSDPRFTIVRNESNQGYTRTINRAITLAQGADVVLLNSDTVVTPRWLVNMRYSAYAQPLTATVTALSDNAGAFSVPEMGRYNPVPSHLSAEQAALAVTRSGAGIGLSVPTGNGFCLYIRRRAIEVIGLFDEERFPRGYGEENDFCMRALHAGWRNIICDKAYVFHKRSQSFLAEKSSLMEAGGAAVRARYPEYRAMISRFNGLEISMMRGRVAHALDSAVAAELAPRVLFVISTQTGGTPQTNLDLMMAMAGRYDCWLLRSDAQTLSLMRLKGKVLIAVETRSLHTAIEPYTHRSNEYDRIIADMLYRYSIDLVHIRHIAWHGLGLPRAAHALDIPVIYSLHDFYTLCYSVNLIGEGGVYLGASGEGARVNSLWPNHTIPPGFLERWRDNMRGFIADCDEFVTTAESAKRVVAEVFPDLADRINVIPHGRDFKSFQTLGAVPLRGEPLRVLVPGNISDSKGAALIERMVALDQDRTVEFHFLGKTIGRIKPIGIHHGGYSREEFAERVRGIAPHVGVVLSVWPETYCHTLTEMWACGLPVLGIDMGAVGDRIKASGAGWLAESNETPEALLARLRAIAADQGGLLAKREAVRNWQQTEGIHNNTAQMASTYRALYRKALAGKAAEGDSLNIGLVVKDLRKGRFPPSAHIRTLGPMAAVSASSRFDVRRVGVEWLLAGGIDRLDGVVIQRDAVPHADADRLMGMLREHGVPWMYEIDDALWDISDTHSDHQIDQAQERAIVRLVEGASLVTCSTEPLAERLRRFAKDVVVVPNAHDENLWCAPLDPAYVRRVRAQVGLAVDRPRLLYMGSPSHAQDLDIVIPAMEVLVEQYPALEVVQIGGGRILPAAHQVERPEELFNYPDFVPWFRAVASACDFAISPLRDNAFNRVKSDIKYLDYALAGLPAVFSSVGPYATAVRHHETGLLVTNDMQSWLDALRWMVAEGGGGRSALAQAALEDARRLRRDRVNELWIRALSRAFDRQS